MLRAVRLVASAVAMLHAATAAAGPIDTLASVLQTYNVYVSGNLGSAAQPYTSDSEGAIAVGGDAYFRSFATAVSTTHGAPALTVGGSLGYEAGTIHGDAWVGGTPSFPMTYGGTTITGRLQTSAPSVPNPPTQVGQPTVVNAGPVPFDFAATGTALAAASQFLNSAAALSQGALGTAQLLFGHQLVLTGLSNAINYFALTAAQFAVLGSGSFTVNAPAGSTAIINVSGTDVTVGSPGNFGFFFNGIGLDHVLFNFYEATSLTMQSFDGSILAPLATVGYTNGQMRGSFVAANLASTTWLNGEFHDDPFAGLLPSMLTNASAVVGEPAPLAAIAAGLLGLGLLRRRRA